MTRATGPPEVYRALIEATAFGTRVIVEAFEASGVAVDSIIACGGLPERNKLLLQVYADVLRRPITVAASTQAPALGAAISLQ
jgi:L-ribulokinase